MVNFAFFKIVFHFGKKSLILSIFNIQNSFNIFGQTFLVQQFSVTNQISGCSYFILKAVLKEEEFVYIS